MAKETVKAPSRATITKITVFVILPIVLVLVVFYLYRQYFFGSNFINKTILRKDMQFKYFTFDEFDSKADKEDIDSGLSWYYRNNYKYLTNSGKNNFSSDTILMLDKARDIIEKEYNSIGTNKIYFAINSGYRTDAHNESVGGKTNSAHRNKDGAKAKAVDIAWGNYNNAQKEIIKEALKRVGFNRIGIANSFIHVDNDLTLPNPANWTY